MPAASGGRTADGDGRGAAGVGRTRLRGGGEAAASSGGEAAAAAGQATAGVGRKAATRSSPRIKRKLEVIEPAPSPRRLTRACTKMENVEGSKNTDICKKATRRKLHDKEGNMKEASDDSENVKRGKVLLEIDDPTEKQAEKDVRKKGSATKLMRINMSLEEDQKARIVGVGFGGLLEIKCLSIHEKLSSWLINNFNIEKSELVFPGRGNIKVDDHAVHRLFGIPMGPRMIDYEKKSGANTFVQFYKTFEHEHDQKAPTFIETEQWFENDGKGLTSDKWLQYWLVFAISSFLCPTSSEKLCVRAFHPVAVPEMITEYNWCQLVVDRLIKGIREFKEGKVKFLSGCLFFLTILYLDSLEVDGLVDQQEEIRASVWTGSLVTKICSMDRVSSNHFGKLQLKQQYRAGDQAAFIPPQRVQEFIDSNMNANSITLDRDSLSKLLENFSSAINQCVSNFTQDLFQLAQTHQAHHQQVNTAAVDAEAGTSSGVAIQRNKTRAKPNLETILDDEIEEETDRPAECHVDIEQTLERRSKGDHDRSKALADDDNVNDGDFKCSEELDDSGSETLDDRNIVSSARDTNNSPKLNADSVDAFVGTTEVDGANQQAQSRLTGLDESREEKAKEGEILDAITKQGQVHAVGQKQVQESSNKSIADSQGGTKHDRTSNGQEGSRLDLDTHHNESSKQAAAEPSEKSKGVVAEPSEGSKGAATEPSEGSKGAVAEPIEGSKGAATEPSEGSKVKVDTASDTHQATAADSQDDEFQSLTPLTPASGPISQMLKLGLLATPSGQAATNNLAIRTYEPPEILDNPRTNLGTVLHDLYAKEYRDSHEIMESMTEEMSMDLQKMANAFEDNMISEMLDVPPLDKKPALHSRLTRKTISKRRKVTIERKVAGTSGKAAETSEKDAPSKEPAVAAGEVAGDNKKPSKQGDPVEQGPSRVVVYSRKDKLEDKELVKVEKKNKEIQQDDIKNSKAFKLAPDAPSFSLGIDENSPIKSKAVSWTNSMISEALNEAAKKSVKFQEGCTSGEAAQGQRTVAYVHRPEAEELYKEVCKWRREPDDNDTSPMIFKADETHASAAEVAKSITMGRSIQTSMMHIATYVISQEQKGLRKKIMSPWIGIKLMQPDATKSVMVKNAFNFLNTKYDLILFPIFEPNQADPKGQGHWFTMALNLEAKKFQVIDSMRPPNSPQLIISANKVWTKVVSMWVKVTKNHPGCTVPTVFRHQLEFIDRPSSFTQFGT